MATKKALTQQATAFGARLRSLREARGISQADLAAQTGEAVSQSAISSWETGQVSPSLENLTVVANSLGLKLAQLVSEEAEDDGGDLDAARRLIEAWSPAFAAIKQVVETAPKPGASKREG